MFFTGEKNLLKVMSTRTKRQWLLPIIAVVGGLCLFLVFGKLAAPSKTMAQLSTERREDILVVPVQTGRDSYGFVMIDTIGQTLWAYEINSRGPAHTRLNLIAARSWKYDRLLQQYNTAEPKPQQVKLLLESLGQNNDFNNRQKQTSDITYSDVNETNVLKLLEY